MEMNTRIIEEKWLNYMNDNDIVFDSNKNDFVFSEDLILLAKNTSEQLLDASSVNPIPDINISVLLSLCKLPILQVQRCACRALLNLSVKNTIKLQLMKDSKLSEDVWYLINNSNDAMLCSYAIGIVANIATLSDVKLLLGNEEIIKTLINYIVNGDEIIKRQACRAICALSTDEQLKLKLAKYGVTRPLVNCLLSDNTHVIWHACKALANLASLESNKFLIIQADAIYPIIELLRIDEQRLQKQAARIIFTLTSHKDIRPKLVENGVIVPLISLLTSNNAAIQRNATGAIANLAIDSLVDLDNNDIISLLFSLSLSNRTNSNVLKQVARALFTLSAHKEASDRFSSNDLIGSILQMFRSEFIDTSIFHHACGIIANLVLHESWRHILARVDIINILILNIDKFNRRRNTLHQLLRALCVLTSEVRVQQIVSLNTNNMVTIMKLFNDKHIININQETIIHKYLLVTVTNLLRHPILQPIIVQNGGLIHLLNILCLSTFTLETRRMICHALEHLDIQISVDNYTLKKSSPYTDYERLVNNHTFSDIQFLIKNRIIYAHRIFIYARCPLLYEEIKNIDINKTFEIKNNNITYRSFLAFLRFIYVDKLTKLADVYIKQVHELGIQYNLPYLCRLCTELKFDTYDESLSKSTKELLKNAKFSINNLSDNNNNSAGRSLRSLSPIFNNHHALHDRASSDDLMLWISSPNGLKGDATIDGESAHYSKTIITNNSDQNTMLSPLPLGLSVEYGPVTTPSTSSIPNFDLSENISTTKLDMFDICSNTFEDSENTYENAESTYENDLYSMVNCSKVPVDIEFRTPTAVLYAHKAILCCRSEYFNALFLTSGLVESRKTAKFSSFTSVSTSNSSSASSSSASSSNSSSSSSIVEFDTIPGVCMALLRYIYIGDRVWNKKLEGSGLFDSFGNTIKYNDDNDNDNNDNNNIIKNSNSNNNNNNNNNNDATNIDVPLGLIQLANQLTLTELQICCELKLMNLLSNSNVLYLFKMANYIKAYILRAACLHYILKNAENIEGLDTIDNNLRDELQQKAYQWEYKLPWSIWSLKFIKERVGHSFKTRCSVQ